jgi:hypothetical protein
LDEQAYVFKDEIVCEKCDIGLRTAAATDAGIKSPVFYDGGPPKSMQLAFAKLLHLNVPANATERDVAVMIDEELAYRQLIKVESNSALKFQRVLKPRRIAIA